MKNIKLNFWVTVEEQAKIKYFAKVYGLGVSDYLRRLGLSGKNPFTQGGAKPLSKRVQSYDVTSADVHDDAQELKKVSPRPHRRDRAA